MENKSRKIKETIKSIIEDSTIHGIPRLVKPNSWISKMAWILFFIVSISYCIYLILTAILDYLQYNTVTNIETIKDMPADFPVITICNLNQLQNNYSSQIRQKYSKLNHFFSDFQMINILLMNEFSSFNDSFKKSLSYSLQESLISCSINMKPCFSSDFFWRFDQIYGNCYSFNTGFNSSGNLSDLIQISKTGNFNGLRLKLFIDNPKNIPDFIERSGYHVIIHNQTYAISANEGYDISPGIETNFAISRLYETNKPKP